MQVPLMFKIDQNCLESVKQIILQGTFPNVQAKILFQVMQQLNELDEIKPKKEKSA